MGGVGAQRQKGEAGGRYQGGRQVDPGGRFVKSPLDLEERRNGQAEHPAEGKLAEDRQEAGGKPGH